ncbi:MAG: 16S rRNA (cytosine(967)-C(5))-methyltransferase RsmB [Coprococcus sp.]
MTGSINTREIVFDMLMAVEKEHTPSHILLSQTLSKYQYLDKKDRAFISRLFRGTLEYQIFLDSVIGQYSSVKLNKIKPPVRMILRMSVYQILKMDHIPDAAACDEAVKLAKRRGLKNLSGFVNGVLRNLARHKEEIVYPDIQKDPVSYLSMRYALPEWVVSMWLEDYDETLVAEMGEAMLADQSTSVRVRDASSVQQVSEELQAGGIRVKKGSVMNTALHLSGYDYLGQIEAFRDGRMVVQDESAMMAAAAAGICGGEYVIDVCAAPGGKSMHLADLLQGTGLVSARDLTAAKTAKIEENLCRTGLNNVAVRVQDARMFCPEDEGRADVVMADLPCSGLGVMGRKADIKLNMTPEKIGQLAALQRDILSVVQRYVKPGGVLIYSTCTVSREENQGNMNWFEQQFPYKLESLDSYLPESVHSDQTARGWIQILPGHFGSDGFFIARFRRIDGGMDE